MHLPSRKKAIIAVLVVTLLTFFLIIFFWRRNTATEKGSIFLKASASGPITTDKLDKVPILVKAEKREVNDEAIGYIQTQRTADGYYNYLAHYDEQCRTQDGKKVCPFDNQRVFQTSNAWTALAYLAAYQHTNEQIYLDQAKTDLNKLIEWCTRDLSQCQWVLVQTVRVYEQTKNQNVLTFLQQVGEYMLSHPSADNKQPMLTSIEARELAMLYGLTKDQRYIDEAQNRLVKARQELDTEDPSIFRRGGFPESVHVCWYSLGELEVAKQKPDPLRLITLRNFIDHASLPRYYNAFAYPVEIQPCIELYYELYKTTSQTNYQKAGDYLLSLFTIDFWDNEKNKKYYGEGGTLMNGHPSLVEIDGKYVSITDSAYTVFLMNL